MSARALLVAMLLASAVGCSTRRATSDRHGGRDRRAERDAGGERAHPAPDRPEAVDDAGPSTPTELDGRVVLKGTEGEVSVRVEVVKRQRERARGLMFREHLDEDAGMLFLFQAPEHQSFWMRNTLLPLDMVFIGADLRVVGVVENATPRTDRSRAVDGDSQYVLEVNAGFARRWGIGPGARVELHQIDQTGVDP